MVTRHFCIYDPFTGIVIVCLLSLVQLLTTPWTATYQALLCYTISQSLLKLISIELVMLSDQLILCRPLLLQPSFFPSIRVFPNDLVLCIRWPRYWSFSFKVCPSSEYSRLISFRIDWFDLLSVQRTLKSLLHHRNSKASVLQCSAFIVQLAYLYMIVEKKKKANFWLSNLT